MNLIIDVGNTRVKLAVFKDEQCEEVQAVAYSEVLKTVEGLHQRYRFERGIVASVGKLPKNVLRSLQLRFPIQILNVKTPLPIKINYKTPETLGVDRIAVMCAFAKAYPDTTGLVIDAGTCVTYDVLTKDGVYHGGIISPGLQMRYNAMHDYTLGLPLLTPKWVENNVGNSTESAMQMGGIHALVVEIQGFIAHFEEEFGVEKIILTGGDLSFLAEPLKNSIFAHSDFLLEGLNYILRYQND